MSVRPSTPNKIWSIEHMHLLSKCPVDVNIDFSNSILSLNALKFDLVVVNLHILF